MLGGIYLEIKINREIRSYNESDISLKSQEIRDIIQLDKLEFGRLV